MTKLKELFTKAKNALRSQPKSGQGKAFVRVIQFFAVMLVLTIFARGASGATMPRVTSATPHNAEILNTIDTTGTITAQGTTDIELPAGLTVSRIVTSQGTTVKEGTPLLEFDLDALDDKIDEQELALRTMELELRELQLPGETDKTVETAQKAVNKAQQAYDEASSAARRASDAVAAADNRHTEAANAYQAAENEFNAAKAEDDEKPEEERDPERMEALWLRCEEASQTQSAAWDELGVAITANEMAQTEKKGAADLLSDAQEALQEARETAAKNAQTQAITNDKNKLAIEQKEKDIEKQEELIKTLQAAKSAGGSVNSTVVGIVTGMPLEEGEETAENAHIRITTADDGYIVECAVDAKEAGEIKVGENLTVKQSGYYYSSDAPVISKTVADAGGMVTIRASLPGSDWEEGSSLEVQVVTKRQQYSSCVPLSAVHTDSAGSYVYVLREENTILGEQTVARRVDVSVLAQDRTNVAIEGAVMGEPILITSTKPVSDGDRVRVEG